MAGGHLESPVLLIDCLFLIFVKIKELFLEFLREGGLLMSNYVSENCGFDMNLKKKKCSDGFIWIESTWRHVKASLPIYNRQNDFQFYLAFYMFQKSCAEQNVDPFNKLCEIFREVNWDEFKIVG